VHIAYDLKGLSLSLSLSLSPSLPPSYVYHLCDAQMADIHKVYLSAMFLAYVFQFQNPVLLSSPMLSLLISSVLARYFQVELAPLSIAQYCTINDRRRLFFMIYIIL